MPDLARIISSSEKETAALPLTERTAHRSSFPVSVKEPVVVSKARIGEGGRESERTDKREH